MIREEAIAMLKRIQEPEAWEPQINQAAFEALDMAIKALCQESSEDVISRQAAINVVKGIDRSFVKYIEELPSAQPEIIRCKDCKYNTYSKKCLQPDSFFLVPADDFYCGYAERRTDE